MDNKVYVSLKNGDLVLFKRIYCKYIRFCFIDKSFFQTFFYLHKIAIWNYDSFIIKNVAPCSFNCMINVAGKLWCAFNNSIKVLNPNSLECEVRSKINPESRYIA